MYYANSARDMFILPGRLRIHIEGLKGSKEFAERINLYLSEKIGISKTTANRYTGNVLVIFDERYIEASAIEDMISDIRPGIKPAYSEDTKDMPCSPAEFAGGQVTKKAQLHISDTQVHEELQIEKNIKRVYSRLIPIVSIVSFALYFASGEYLMPLAVLVMVYPFAIKPSILVTQKSVAANAYFKGAIIKSASKLEQLCNADTIAFGNTNLLTMGRCKVATIITEEGSSEGKVLALAATCPGQSNASIRIAIREEIKSRNPDYKYTSNISGIDEVFVGNKEQMKARKLSISSYLSDERKLKHLGQYPMFVAYNGKIAGLMGFQYIINENSVSAVEAMRETGVEKVIIVSDEDEELVKIIALDAGVEAYYNGLPVKSKAEKIAELKREGRTIAVIQDSMDDSFNKAADIYIVVSNIDDIKLCKYADFIITNDRLMLISELIALSKFSREDILQNCIISLGMDAIGVLLLITRSITPYTALLYKFINSFIVLINARKPKSYNIS